MAGGPGRYVQGQQGKATASTGLEALLTALLQIIGTGSRTVNNVLSLVSKRYPRALVILSDRLLCLKLDDMEMTSYKWLKKARNRAIVRAAAV